MAEIQVGSSLARGNNIFNEKTPFHILLIGNFRGTAKRDAASKPVFVDRDNVFELPEELGIRLDGILASQTGDRQDIEFAELEDFEPDQLFEKLQIFEQLRALRRRLKNPKHFDKAAAEVLSWAEAAEEPPQQVAASNSTTSDAEAVTVDQLFDNILEQSPTTSDSPVESGDWKKFIQGVVAESDVQRVDPRVDDLVATVDLAIQKTMRMLLNGKLFQQLERNWRGLDFLTRQVETHSKLKFYVLDISEEQFQQLLSDENWQQSWLAETITKPAKTPGATAWGLVGCLFPFSASPDDSKIAARLAELSASGGAATAIELAGEKSKWIGADEDSLEAWSSLSRLRSAGGITGLWPRFQIRVPYGKKYRPTEQIDFEEMPKDGSGRLAWASPVWLATAALAQQYNESGWGMDPSAVHQFEGLPLFFDPRDEGDAHPCGEYLITDEELSGLIKIGLSPVVSFKNQDRVQIRGLQSISGKSLQGPWNG